MSTKRSAGTGVPTQKTPQSAASRKKDRSPNLCIFTFADGRQCRTPRCSGHLHLCYFHAQKEAESLAAQQVGEDISRFLPTKLLTACDLGVAMSRLFCAVVQGQVKPKVASTLAYLAQTMLQSIPIAQDEYINSFDTDTWRSAVRASFRNDDPVDAPASKPAPSPHTPLPRTSAEFAQQLLAGLNSSRSTPPTPSAPSRDTGSSGSPSAPTPGSAPVRTSSTQPAPSSPAPPPSPSNSQPAPASPAPPPVPPGFGAPANWDALILPKPRRRFSRLWHSS